jgi:hypothetical protein
MHVCFRHLLYTACVLCRRMQLTLGDGSEPRDFVFPTPELRDQAAGWLAYAHIHLYFHHTLTALYSGAARIRGLVQLSDPDPNSSSAGEGYHFSGKSVYPLFSK